MSPQHTLSLILHYPSQTSYHYSFPNLGPIMYPCVYVYFFNLFSPFSLYFIQFVCWVIMLTKLTHCLRWTYAWTAERCWRKMHNSAERSHFNFMTTHLKLVLGAALRLFSFYFCLIFFFTLFLMAYFFIGIKETLLQYFFKKITSLDPHSLELLCHFSALFYSYPPKRVVTIWYLLTLTQFSFEPTSFMFLFLQFLNRHHGYQWVPSFQMQNAYFVLFTYWYS